MSTILQCQQQDCEPSSWQVYESNPWLMVQANGGTLTIYTDQAGLALGVYSGMITVTATGVHPLSIPIELQVVEHIFDTYLSVKSK
jgi:hypothetical protein